MLLLLSPLPLLWDIQQLCLSLLWGDCSMQPACLGAGQQCLWEAKIVIEGGLFIQVSGLNSDILCIKFSQKIIFMLTVTTSYLKHQFAFSLFCLYCVIVRMKDLMRHFTQMCWWITLDPANIFLQVGHREHLFALSQISTSSSHSWMKSRCLEKVCGNFASCVIMGQTHWNN